MKQPYTALHGSVLYVITEWYRANKPEMSSLAILADINNSTPLELFEKYCEWNGLINMATELWNAVETLQNADK